MATTAFLDAATNKIAFARDHYARLNELRAGAENERQRIQSAFEGVIGNGISAGDQVAAALATALGLDLGRRNTPRELLRALARPDAPAVGGLSDCVGELDAWEGEAIVHD